MKKIRRKLKQSATDQVFALLLFHLTADTKARRITSAQRRLTIETMNKVIVCALLLFSISSSAKAFDLLPAAADLPIESSIPDRYRSQVQGMFFSTTLLEGPYNLLREEVNYRSRRIARPIEASLASGIDRYTPLRHEHVFFSAAVAYTILVTKSYTQRARSPWWKNVNHEVTIGQNFISTGVTMPFGDN